jgi:proteasome lid subunit RPN8/RPN11
MLAILSFKDGRNWYSYCYNNLANLMDANGLKPGDKFKTADDAAMDFAKIYGAKSDAENQEYGAFIYQNADGSFSYSTPESSSDQRKRGDRIRHGSSIDPKMLPPAPVGTKPVGIIHTHPHGRNHGGVLGFVFDDPLNGTASHADLEYLINNRQYGSIMWIVNGNTGQIDKFFIPNFLLLVKLKVPYRAHSMLVPQPGPRWKPKPRRAYNEEG